jgi:hypothetical protein
MNGENAACPSCLRLIDPPPKRSRKCPHCKKPIVVRQGKLLTEQAAEKLDKELAAKEAKQRLVDGRKRAATEIREAKKSDVIVGFKPLVSAEDCSVCQAANDKFFPLATCTPEMLPPYGNCEIPEGCRATFVSVLSQEYEEILAKYPPHTDAGLNRQPSVKTGCLSALIFVCALMTLIIGKAFLL